jgi:hypothetical protein
MLTHYFKLLTAIFEPPIYVIYEGMAGTYCDKLTEPKGSSYKRTRYLITGSDQCTCMQWMKSDEPRTCKHLKMLAGDYTWIPTKTGRDYVAKIIEELTEHCDKALPESARYWLSTLKYEDLPDTGVTAISLGIHEELNRPFKKIVATKRFADKKLIMVEFNYLGSACVS